MALPTARAAYQHNQNVSRVGHREPFACPAYRAIFNDISREAIAATSATTQAAYLLRLSNIRRLMKSLG